MSTNTESIKSAPLLPVTAELAQYSPRKVDIKKDDIAGSITITSAYSFNSGDIDIGDRSSGAALAGYGINLCPVGMSITFGYGIAPVKDAIIEKYNLDEFIGILSDEEADKMRKGIKLFRENLDDELTNRKKLLFGE